MNILGITLGHNGSACVVEGGKLVAALSSERLTRHQKSHGISNELLDYVLAVAGIDINGIDALAVAEWHPTYAHGCLELQRENGQPVECLWNSIYDDEQAQTIALIRGRRLPAFHIGHQKCHCAAAYYTSSFDQSWCFSMDASGAKLKNNSLIAKGEGNKLHAVECPNLMIGVAYGYFCEWLGVGPQMHKAGSLMGLAAYGKVLPKVAGNLDYYVNSAFIKEDNGHHPWMGWLWNDLTEGRAHRWCDIQEGQESRNIAATIQYLLEKTVLKTMERIPEQGANICLGGGSLLNCNANSEILNSGQFAKVHLFPACTDDGLAVGSALYCAHHIHDEPRHQYTDAETCYLGRDRATDDQPDLDALAGDIADAKIVAWCHGRAEYGPRALGNRSILADPRNVDHREHLNRVKRREWFRPFAPVVMEDHLHNWFDFKADKSPFMLFTAKVKQPERVPAICHIDGTARMQTVTRDGNPLLYDLIEAFYRLTGVPMLLNTSMNESGVPMVENDGDIESFWNNVPVDIMVVDGKIKRR